MVACFNCENGLIHNPYWYEGPMVCPYCEGTGEYKRIEINHRKYRAGAWGYWKDWGIRCLKCEALLDYRNAAQPDKCPSCGFDGECKDGEHRLIGVGEAASICVVCGKGFI